MDICSTHLWKVPMIQGHNGSDFIFKQLINKYIIVLQSFLIHMISCKHTEVKVNFNENLLPNVLPGASSTDTYT